MNPCHVPWVIYLACFPAPEVWVSLPKMRENKYSLQWLVSLASKFPLSVSSADTNSEAVLEHLVSSPKVMSEGEIQALLRPIRGNLERASRGLLLFHWGLKNSTLLALYLLIVLKSDLSSVFFFCIFTGYFPSLHIPFHLANISSGHVLSAYCQNRTV